MTKPFPPRSHSNAAYSPSEVVGGGGIAAAAPANSGQPGFEAQAGAAAISDPHWLALFGAQSPRNAIHACGDDRALESVMRKREEQIASGFTADADDQKPIAEFVPQLENHARDARAAWPYGRKDRDPAALRRDLVQLTALGLALIERLDREHFPD